MSMIDKYPGIFCPDCIKTGRVVQMNSLDSDFSECPECLRRGNHFVSAREAELRLQIIEKEIAHSRERMKSFY